jgi:hypothetical protein
MFKYNELSDLLNGSLVTPLSKTDDGLIRCIDSEGNECYYEFDDFDFDKLPEDRVIEEPISEPEPEVDPEPTPEPEKDDSEYDGTDEPEPEPEVDPETGEVVEKPGFLNAVELEEFKENYSDILKEISKDKRTKIRVWRDII